jgi:DNA primase
MATADTVAEIKARLDLVDVVGEYVRLTQAGRAFKGLCPFHAERTPSFQVSPDKQVWYCFGCDAGGDLFSFVQKVERCEFPHALELLAAKAGVELVRSADQGERGRQRQAVLEVLERAARYYHHVLLNTPQGEAGRRLLERRKLSPKTVERWQLGYAPEGWDNLTSYLLKRGHPLPLLIQAGLATPRGARGAEPLVTVAALPGPAADSVPVATPPLAAGISERGAYDRFRHRLMFPIRDERGKVVGFGGRAFGEAIPKYLNSPGTLVYDKSRVLYGLDTARQAIAESGLAVLVEGYVDVLQAHQAGYSNVVAASGTALTEPQLKLLKRYAQNLVLVFDADSAGEAATRRSLDLIHSLDMRAQVLRLPGGQDPDDFLRSQPDAWPGLVALAPSSWDYLLERALRDAGMLADAGVARPSDAATRVEALRRVFPILASIREVSVREVYVSKVAPRLGVSEAGLLEDLARGIAPPAAPQTQPRAPAWARPAGEASAPGLALPAPGHNRMAEEWFLALILERPELKEEARALISLEDFAGPGQRELAGALLGGERSLSREELWAEAAEPARAALARVELLCGAVIAPEGHEETVRELRYSARRIKDMALRRQLGECENAMSAAESAGDLARRRDLQNTVLAISKRLRQLSNGEDL